MDPRPRRPRLPLAPTTVAFVLAIALISQVAGLVIARSPAVAATSVVAAPAASVLGSALGATDRAAPLAASLDAGRSLVRAMSPTATSPAKVRIAAAPAKPKAAQPKPAKAPKPSSKPASSKSVSAASFHGRNHVWIPALRINKSVQSFPCSRSRPPDAGVYRWGCGGANNVYLLSHAWSTFKPLHDAYVTGRLRKGMQVFYADGSGKVRAYRVAWWRVVRPTTAASWAWAPQAQPSMTLQTCVGARSAYRLMVRLLQVR
jgi:Sortase domain